MAEHNHTSGATVIFEEQDESFSNDTFPKMIRRARAEYGINAAALHQILGIGEYVFRGKCNGNRPASRDFVIAVCAVLMMDTQQTEKALRCHKKQFPGFDRHNRRDNCIVQFIDHAEYTKPSNIIITELNHTLTAGGFSELDIIDHRTGNKSKKNKLNILSKYNILKSTFQVITSKENGEYLYGDQYNSLETEFNIDRAKCVGHLCVENKKTKEILHLRYSSDSSIDLFDSEHTIIPRHFSRIQDTGDLSPIFVQLRSSTLRYRTMMLNQLDDTRNFGDRVSACLKHGQIYVFAEEYNYSCPEAHEYYVMEYYNGKYILSVYNRSAFMFLYMGEQAYHETMSRESPHVLLCFDSMESIESFKEKEGVPHWQKELLPFRKRAYRRMIEKIDKLRTDLSEKKRFIRNPAIIGDYGDETGWICWFFHVEKEFDCYYGSDDYADNLLQYGKEEAIFTLPNGENVTVSISDLVRAFELGFHDIAEICKVKFETGIIDVKY